MLMNIGIDSISVAGKYKRCGERELGKKVGGGPQERYFCFVEGLMIYIGTTSTLYCWDHRAKRMVIM